MARRKKPAECKYTSEKAGAPPGRPRKIQSPEEFDRLVDAHVLYCLEHGDPVTWTGMALALGLTSRGALDHYGKTYPEFSDPVKRARFIVENSYENRLHGQSPTGAIFALKNMNWKDKTEHDVRSGDGSMSPRPLSEFYADLRSPGGTDPEPDEEDHDD